MKNTALKIGLVALTTVLFAACGSQPRNYDSRYRNYDSRYDDSNVCHNCGTVQRIDRVQLRRDHNSGGGAVLGAIIGGVVGSNIGDGDGRTAATAAGAVAGGVIGYQVENNNRNRNRQNAYQIDVSLDDGRFAQVTQRDNPRLSVGNHVVIRNDQVYRLR